jgi:hypothetical protein
MAEQRFSLGWRRGSERPERWRMQLIPATTPDVTKPRSLAHAITVLFDQQAEGSCTANAGCLAAMMIASLEGTPVPTLSRSWMYYQERVILGSFPQDSGADVIDEYDVDSTTGNIADSVWPYDANPSEKPPANAANAQKYKPVAAYQPIAASDFRDGILTALDNNQPVTIGFSFFEGWMTSWTQTGILDAASMDYVAGGHAVTILGWVPPGGKFPQGAYLIQNSWGATSPNNTAIHPDCTPGRGFIPADVFAMASVGAEADAVVGNVTPAVLSVTVTAPASAAAGQPSAWSAAVTGAPNGSVLTYAWTFSDGGHASGQNVSYTPIGGITSLVGTCTASVATTGASATGSASVVVQPTPPPGPGPTPTGPSQAQIDAVFTAWQQEIQAMEPQYTGDQCAELQLQYGLQTAAGLKQNIDALYTSTQAREWTPVPKPERGA